jgi:hypothetical protein
MKVHCFGVGQEVNGVMETRAYCVHTDNDGDQIAWKSMEAPHRHAPIITRTEEVLMGTGKFDGRTGTQSLDCAYSQGPTDDLSYGCECEVHGKYMMP